MNLYLLALSPLLSSASSSPESPHVPRCQSRIPRTKTKPCSWFEGWYVRISDPSTLRSFAAVVGTMNGTGESVAAVLHCKAAGGARVTSPGSSIRKIRGAFPMGRALGEEAPSGMGSMLTSSEPCAETGVSQAIFEGATLTVGEDKRPVTSDPDDTAPPVFDWVAPGHGFFRAKGFGRTEVSITVGDVTLQANLTEQLPWKFGDPGAGPEGWFSEASRILPPELIPPCRWFIHSLGSAASYRFTDSAGDVIVGQGWAHEEKNWGSFFPTGHVWFQGISTDNSVQVVGAALHFSVRGGIRTPDVITIGIRTPQYSIDLRNFDLPGTFFTGLDLDACSGHFRACAVMLSGSNSRALRTCISASAAPASFSPPLYAPSADATWNPSCKESFGAVIEIQIWEMNSLADLFLGTSVSAGLKVLVKGAALEFCGDRVCV